MKATTRRQVLSWGAVGAAASFITPAGSATARNARILLSTTQTVLSASVSYLAEAMGYYQDEGLSIERVPNNSGPTQIVALVAGEGDLAHTTPGESLAAIARGQKLKILMALSNAIAQNFVISKDYAQKHGITATTPVDQRLAAIKSFRGIRIGITAPGSGTDLCARHVLKVGGLDPAQDAQLMPLGSTPNSVAAMGRGTIDALVASPPSPEIAITKLGAVSLLNDSKGEIPGFQGLGGYCIIARASSVEQNPELYSALARADVRAMRYLNENPNAAADLLYKTRFSSVIDAETWPLVWENNLSLFRTPFATKENVESWVTMGMVPGVADSKLINSSEVVDMRFVDQAVRDLGWRVPG